MSTGTAVRTYYRGHAMTAMRQGVNSTTRYYHFDNQGTTQALTDRSGTVTDRFVCDAWGVELRRTGQSLNRAWYIGGQGYYRHRELSLDYVRQRYYTRRRGRWLSPDPVQLIFPAAHIAYSDREHWELPYAYVANQPCTSTDPSGAIRVGYSKSCEKLPNHPVKRALEAICGGNFADVDECMGSYCPPGRGNVTFSSCFANFCSGKTGLSISCLTDDASPDECKGNRCKGSDRCAYTPRAGQVVICLCPKAFLAQSSKCDLMCTLMHEIIHTCGIRHFANDPDVDPAGAKPVTKTEDCRCFNCVASGFRKCDGYYQDPQSKRRVKNADCDRLACDDRSLHPIA